MLERKLNFDFRTQLLLIKAIGAIDQFNGWWREVGKQENKALKRMRDKMIVRNTAASLQLEEIKITSHHASVFFKKGNRLQSKDPVEQLAFGYFEVYEKIQHEFGKLSFSEANLKELHEILYQYNPEETDHRGNYRQMSFQIVANHPGGGQRMIYNTTALHAVQQEIQEVLHWVTFKLKEGLIHPLLITAMLHYELISILPFQSGNGFIARLCTHWLLLQTGYHFILYTPLDEFLAKKEKEYRQVLFSGQKERFHNQELIGDWVLFFLNVFQEAISELSESYSQETVEDNIYLNDRQKQIIQFIEQHKPVKIGDIAVAMPHCSKNTLKKDLQFLAEEVLIRKMGERKGTVYIV